MKLKLNKKRIKSLSNDKNNLPLDQTGNIAGGYSHNLVCRTDNCYSLPQVFCRPPMTYEVMCIEN